MASRSSETSPSRKAVFECICREYDCSVSFAVISKRQDLFPRGCGNISAWFGAQKDSFLLSKDQNGAIITVSAFSRRVRLCFDYTPHKKCSKMNCQYLHVCKSYVAGYCRFGDRCKMNHAFHDQKDQKVLSKLKLNGLTDAQLLKVVQHSLPRVCQDYNEGQCLKGDKCSQIHICKYFIKKKCDDKDGCSLEHEAGLTTTHARTILAKYEINPNGATDIVLRMLVVCDDPAASKNRNFQSTTGSGEGGSNRGHIHEDKPNTSICSDFLLGKCKKARSCSGHHCSRPFHWQYKVPGPEEWISFSEKDNDALEKLFCDPTQDKCGVDVTQFCSDRTLTCGHDGKHADVNLQNKKIYIADESIGVLRRLSTESFVTSPNNPLATKWTWYWKDEHECWREYAKDRLGGDLQFLIEEAFLNKPTTPYQFPTSDHNYKVFFATMLQLSLTHDTVRLVKRRPLILVSDEKIQQLKSQHDSTSTNKQEGTRLSLPIQWSAMSRDEQFKRVKLDPSSQEYKTVETPFRNTMKERVTNISIERVQNPFMWEKYCRKKENMATVKSQGREKTSADEKRLFHGTSPEAVVAICKQNFDWRLHGKNATKYGEGSYFAVNASYSHSYAKRDVDSCQYMFLANVMVGSYTQGHSDLRRPPAINPSKPESDLYDSCVDDQYNPTVFVVFDTDQFYPAYVIKYSAVSHTAPAAALKSGVQQPTQTSRPNTAVPLYHSRKFPKRNSNPGYSSGEGLRSSSTTSLSYQSSNYRPGKKISLPGRRPSLVTRVYSAGIGGRTSSKTSLPYQSRNYRPGSRISLPRRRPSPVTRGYSAGIGGRTSSNMFLPYQSSNYRPGSSSSILGSPPSPVTPIYSRGSGGVISSPPLPLLPRPLTPTPPLPRSSSSSDALQPNSCAQTRQVTSRTTGKSKKFCSVM